MPPCAASASAGATPAREIEAVRARVNAACVLAPDYGTTGWLAFDLPKGTCVAQQSQRIRWVNMPEPSAAQLAGKLLYVRDVDQGSLKEAFARVDKVAEVPAQTRPAFDRDLCARCDGAADR